MSTDNPDLVARFNRILEETITAMDASGIRYAFIGGVASGGLGRPRSTRDIDIFVMPEDAAVALRALGKSGFETEKTDPVWLYKAFKDGILVDIIFKSKGDIYLDQEMYRRMTTAEFHGKRVKLISPEDLLLVKAVAHSEVTPNHWHDAIALLYHASLDWTYLLQRARRAPRRILSLLVYAQSCDVAVPNHVIRSLYESIYGEGKVPLSPPQHAYPQPVPPGSERVQSVSLSDHRHAREQYELGHLRERIAEDPRAHELNIRLEQEGEKILLEGTVTDPSRREAVERITRECFPAASIDNRIKVVSMSEPFVDEVML